MPRLDLFVPFKLDLCLCFATSRRSPSFSCSCLLSVSVFLCPRVDPRCFCSHLFTSFCFFQVGSKMLPGLHVCRRRGGLPVLTPRAQTSDGDGYSVSAVFPCVFWMNAAGDGAPDHVDTVGFLEARQQSLKRKKWIGPPGSNRPPRLQRLGPTQLNPRAHFQSCWSL